MVYLQKRGQIAKTKLSWFNLHLRLTRYNFWTSQEEKIVHVDQAACREAERFIENCRSNQGRFPKVIDDITGREFNEEEIKQLENEAPSVFIPFVSEDEFVEVPRKIVAKAMRPKIRKYKPRIIISKQLRQAVHQLFEHKCHRCKSDAANQIHHMDGDPSNNDIKNLELLCYPCHLIADGRKIARYTTK